MFSKYLYNTIISPLKRIGKDYVFFRIRKDRKLNRIKKEFEVARSYCAIQKLIEDYDFETVLDIGTGDGMHSDILLQHDKKVTCIDYGFSRYFKNNKNRTEAIVGDYNEYVFDETFDCIWASHILEHQLNPHKFLTKLHDDLKSEGILAITVPPLKFNIVGGHVNLFNSGLLIYRLILAGFDCQDACLLEYGNNISVILKKRTINQVPKLSFDSGDIQLLKQYFPKEIQDLICSGDSFNGDIEEINWY